MMCMSCVGSDAQICKEISFGFSRYNAQNNKPGLLDKKNHKAAAEIDVGFAGKATLANLVKNQSSE